MQRWRSGIGLCSRDGRHAGVIARAEPLGGESDRRTGQIEALVQEERVLSVRCFEIAEGVASVAERGPESLLGLLIP